MMDLILGPLGGILAAVGAVLAALLYGRKSGRDAERNKALKDSAKRQEDGRDAVKDLRGADRDELADRLRSNHAEW